MMSCRRHLTQERILEIHKQRWMAILKKIEELEDLGVDGRKIILRIK